MPKFQPTQQILAAFPCISKPPDIPNPPQKAPGRETWSSRPSQSCSAWLPPSRAAWDGCPPTTGRCAKSCRALQRWRSQRISWHPASSSPRSSGWSSGGRLPRSPCFKRCQEPTEVEDSLETTPSSGTLSELLNPQKAQMRSKPVLKHY